MLHPGLHLDPDGTAGLAGGPADGLSDLQVLDNFLAAVPADTPVADATADADANDPEITDPVDSAIADEPAADADEPKTADDDTTADAEPAVTPKAADKTDATASADDDGTVDGLTVKAINSQIAKSPEFKAVLDSNPELRKQMFYTARRAERANQYDELFQTPALAKEMKVAADDSFAARTLYETDPTKFLEKLVYDSLEKNEAGELKLGVNGLPTSTGRYEETMTTYRHSWYDAVQQGAQHLLDSNQIVKDPAGGLDISGEDALEAVRILQVMTEGKSSIPAPGSAPANALPPTQRPAQAQLSPEVQAQLKELADLKSAATQTTGKNFESFQTQVDQKSRAAVEADVKNLLAKRLPANAAISDYTKEKIVSDTVNSITRSAKTNTAHQSILNRSIRNVSRDDAGVAKVVAIQQAYAKDLIGRELAKVLSKATQGIVAQNQATQQKVTAQVNRREAQTSGGVSSPTRPDARQAAREIDATAKKSGKVLSDLEFVDQVVASQRAR